MDREILQVWTYQIEFAETFFYSIDQVNSFFFLEVRWELRVIENGWKNSNYS